MHVGIPILIPCLGVAAVAAVALPAASFWSARKAVPPSFQPGQIVSPFPRLRQSSGFLFLLCLLFVGVFPMTFYPWFDMDFDNYDRVIRKMPLLPRQYLFAESGSIWTFIFINGLALPLLIAHAVALPFLFETCGRLCKFFQEDIRYGTEHIVKWLLFSGGAFAVLWVFNSAKADSRGAGWLLTDCLHGFALLPPAGLIAFFLWRPVAARLFKYQSDRAFRNQTYLLTLLCVVSLLRLPYLHWAESIWTFLFALPGLALFQLAHLLFVPHPAWQGLIFATLFFAGTLSDPWTRRIAFWLIGFALVLKPLVQ